MEQRSAVRLWGYMIVPALGGALMTGGCPLPQIPTGGAGTTSTPPPSVPADGQALYKFITETDPFSNWEHFPERPGVFDSSPPHGPRGRVWINDVVASTLDTLDGGLPAGSIIVKENLDEGVNGLTGKALTVISKVPGFNPTGGDWFWAQFGSDGSVMAEGVIEMCLACHSGARDNDYIFLHQFGAN